MPDVKTLYVHRPLLNGAALLAWAKEQSFGVTLPAADLHATIAFSKTPVDWGTLTPRTGNVTVSGGPRSVEALGDKGAVVLRFESDRLDERHQQFTDAGATWSHPSYKPHVTITYEGGDIDLAKVVPFDAPLEFGPEVFGEVNENWLDGVKLVGAEDDFSESDHPRAENGQFGSGGSGKQSGERRADTAEANIPMAGARGKRLDAEITRNVAKQKADAEANGKALRAQQRADTASAKSLLKEHGAAMVKRYGPKLGGEAKVREHLEWMSKIKPDAFIKFVDKYRSEQSANDALDELAADMDDAAGKLTEQEQAEADRSQAEREEMPEGAFLEPGERKYPVKEKRDGVWVYSRDLLLAAAREARMHGHEDLADRADVIRKRQFAQDGVAMDKATVRRVDQDGHLFVEMTPISKANVCAYYGREIPDAERFGLDPSKLYRMLRDPGELAKAASTFAGKPLLLIHTPINADDHPREETVGAVGTEVEFRAPYLVAPLSVWDGEAIGLIESGEQKELSSAYHYRADMTPGIFEGEPYDGVMRDIAGNHVALVKMGRAGPDVVVGDSAPEQGRAGPTGDSKQEIVMKHTKLSLMAATAHGALLTYLKPKLAQDAKVDLTPVLNGITSKNFKAKRNDIVAGLKTATTGKLAKDASIDDVTTLLVALDEVAPAEDDLAPNSGVPNAGKVRGEDEESDDKKREFLKGKLSEDDLKAWDDLNDDDDQEAMDDDEDDKEPKVTKKAMDSAIEASVRATEARVLRAQREIREAEDFVRPYVGKLAMAHDSAAGVYRTALGALGVKDVDKLHPDALRPILEAQPVPGSAPKQERVAMDSTAAKSFAERYPNAARVGQA